MSTEFSRTLSLLRKERGVSQRVAAADLGVSQALLSHYENGIREQSYTLTRDFLIIALLTALLYAACVLLHREVLKKRA